ncbi:MAG: hypothetical protein L6R45_10110 [Anaerolineae bacterium]|nr:hypothetical protein [Anaerolineae bacterium]
METHIRSILYQQLSGRRVAFDPQEPEPFDLVDLTRDVTNATRIYHRRTECVREALEGASLIVTDSQPLAGVVKQILPRAIVMALPFGRMKDEGGRMTEENFHPSSFIPHPFTVGLLNHTGEMMLNNHYALKLLKSLDRELVVYGEALPGIEGEVKQNFGEFAAMCDILLLPSLPGALNSTTLPLSLMAGNTAILASNAPGYWELDAATGVQLLPNDPAAWRAVLTNLEAQPAKLRAMHERNQAFANRLNRESYSWLAFFADQFISPPAPVKEDCGCTKRKDEGGRMKAEGKKEFQPSSFIPQPLESAPTRPDQDQLNNEKES